jgi:hypothetical protein
MARSRGTSSLRTDGNSGDCNEAVTDDGIDARSECSLSDISLSLGRKGKKLLAQDSAASLLWYCKNSPTIPAISSPYIHRRNPDPYLEVETKGRDGSFDGC